MTIAAFLIATTAPFLLLPLPEPLLADARGGFALPGGLNVAIAIQSDTHVDGSLLLRTVYRVDQALPQLLVYAPEAVQNTPTDGEKSIAPPQPVGITIMFDRQNGSRIGPSGPAASSLTVVGGGQAGIGNAPPGTNPTNLSPGAPPVDVPSGRLALTNTGTGQQVQLQSNKLEIAHLFGDAIGSVVVNSGRDRVIDTSPVVGIDIGGATPANLGSSMLRIDALASAVTTDLLPR